MLETQQLTVRFGGHVAVNAVSCSFAPGTLTAIVGPNGAGKSTLLQCLAGLLPHEGRVQLLGRPLPDWPLRERARRLSWLGQGGGVAQDLSAWDVAMLGRLPHQAWLAPPSDADRIAVEQALRATQAWDWRDRPLGQLSGGERRRVLLARVLAVQADVLLMDEPLANLDPPHQVDWLEQVQCLKAQGTTVVSVLHEIGMALHADEVVVMNAGRVVHHGPCDDLATREAIESVFAQRIRIRPVDGQWVVLPRLA